MPEHTDLRPADTSPRFLERIDAVTTFVSVRATKVNQLLSQLEPVLKRLLTVRVRLGIRSQSVGIVEADPQRLGEALVRVVEVLAKRSATTLTVTSEDVDQMPSSETTMAKGAAYTSISIDDNNWVAMNDLDRMRVYSALREVAEAVIVESTPGKGTHVRLFLRRLGSSSATAPRGDVEVPVKATGTVLVVEDEGIIRAPLCRALRNDGYTVLEANNGEDALRVMQEHHAPIHLVVTDVRMPMMRGDELVSLLRDWYPNMRVMFISGYSTEHADENGSEVEGVAFLTKECSLWDVTHRVREIFSDVQSRL